MLRKFTTLFVFFTLVSGTSYSQCMEEDADIFGGGLKLGVYNISFTGTGAYSAVRPGRAFDVITLISYDYNVSSNFTFGVQLCYNVFIMPLDSMTLQHTIAGGTDIYATGAFHFVNTSNLDVYIGADLGVGYIQQAYTHPNSQSSYIAFGLAYNLDLGARYFLNEHFALQFSAGYSGHYYPGGTAIVIGGAPGLFSLLFNGSSYGIGTCYKF